MTTLSLDYRCDNRYRPHFLNHAEVEEIALQSRGQLVGVEDDALPLTVLREITGLDINGLKFELWVDLEHPIRDEKGKAVFGCCEFDPGAGSDAAILSVSPVGAHSAETGHGFRVKLDGLSTATWTAGAKRRGGDDVYSGLDSVVNFGFIFLKDSPSRLKAWA